MTSNDDPPRRRRKTLPMNVVPDPLATTVPGRSGLERARTDPPTESSASRTSSPEAFPPNGWAHQENVVTSASAKTIPPVERGSGQITLTGNRLSETLAREMLHRRFSMAGLSIQHDYQFHRGNTLVRLDGYDPARNIGYQYVSHADADVVTDHDTATELGLKQLALENRVRVLIIHDADAPSPGALLDRIDEFLVAIGLARPAT